MAKHRTGFNEKDWQTFYATFMIRTDGYIYIFISKLTHYTF
jgi:hypothetical protein